MRQGKLSSRRLAAVLALLAAVALTGTATAEVKFRTVGSASDTTDLFRSSPTVRRIDRTLDGTVTRTASAIRHSGLAVKTADRRTLGDRDPFDRYGTVARTHTENRLAGRGFKSARPYRSLANYSLARPSTVTRTRALPATIGVRTLTEGP